jgi:hypothetical protein
MTTSMATAALLVLEGPWWIPKEKPKRPTILSFVEGLESYKGDFNIYYSNFYERRGFRRALEDDLIHTREARLFLYIGAHGYGRMIGGLDAKRGMQLATLLRQVKKVANYTHIEGVVISSCNIGTNIDDLVRTLKSSHIAWIFGYTCDIEWLTSTFIDVSVFEHLMALPRADLRSRDAILGAFAGALSRFSGNYRICDADGRTVCLKDAVSLVIQPRGRGRKPRDERASLINRLGWGDEGNAAPQQN